MIHKISASRYHDFSCGHRVAGHESKCSHLHGHNYRVHFFVQAEDSERPLDSLGRVLDFSVINSRLCQWLERNWDHKFLVWKEDSVMSSLIIRGVDTLPKDDPDSTRAADSFVRVPFNPTAENMAEHLLLEVGPTELEGTGIQVVRVVVEETRKCSAEISL